ncbi:winged helix-turn-helix transcriptional regulator [Labilibacter sediminis]|nr:winged helix-turn-helix transcriptional regulator [Labilibacter sediminis]
MVQAKSDLFNADLNERAMLFKALAHPARLRILQFLAESESCITGDISDELPLSRTTVNQHIKELKEIGLIQGQIDGVRTKYCLCKDKVEELKVALQEFIDNLDINNYKCK